MPRDGGQTRERILQTAERLMIEQGYNATSLDQLIAESETSKGAFFHHFRSKSDLAVQLTERYVQADLGQLTAGLTAVGGIEDASQRVIEFVRFYEDAADEMMSQQSACLYATVLAERELTGGPINELVAQATIAWRVAIVDLLEAAMVDRADIDIDLDALADHLYTTFEGGYILCRTLEDPSAMRAQLRVLRQLLESLLLAREKSAVGRRRRRS